mmetsp:Transcript_13444/g.32981  ORF Transcript_13444/g.32981 Transcript_13444/m.32981 type:complete len:538 (+) Transcript_13444:852-2465(+)
MVHKPRILLVLLLFRFACTFSGIFRKSRRDTNAPGFRFCLIPGLCFPFLCWPGHGRSRPVSLCCCRSLSRREFAVLRLVVRGIIHHAAPPRARFRHDQLLHARPAPFVLRVRDAELAVEDVVFEAPQLQSVRVAEKLQPLFQFAAELPRVAHHLFPHLGLLGDLLSSLPPRLLPLPLHVVVGVELVLAIFSLLFLLVPTVLSRRVEIREVLDDSNAFAADRVRAFVPQFAHGDAVVVRRVDRVNRICVAPVLPPGTCVQHGVRFAPAFRRAATLLFLLRQHQRLPLLHDRRVHSVQGSPRNHNVLVFHPAQAVSVHRIQQRVHPYCGLDVLGGGGIVDRVLDHAVGERAVLELDDFARDRPRQVVENCGRDAAVLFFHNHVAHGFHARLHRNARRLHVQRAVHRPPEKRLQVVPHGVFRPLQPTYVRRRQLFILLAQGVEFALLVLEFVERRVSIEDGVRFRLVGQHVQVLDRGSFHVELALAPVRFLERRKPRGVQQVVVVAGAIVVLFHVLRRLKNIVVRVHVLVLELVHKRGVA